ncbi:hypothetical protein IAI10_03420 [Clostridium sp. 19966]|uniref:papain-like cysteine protease family protein n=1 Tax=Clostridium sp. 19966 TaxID=2768166 RepID=UPI0028DF8713|nr:papain-like cysteine protease family protein [Clostridium sp. 19966]MDT8715709.1 hypothetical protein [Clostridium sp. 19966]
MKIKKIIPLFLTLCLTLCGYSTIKVSADTITKYHNNTDIVSLIVPDKISSFASLNFQTLIAGIKESPESYGIQKAMTEKLYLGNAFNIFEDRLNVLQNQSIYYYPILYNDEIVAIFTVGLDEKGGIYSTIGKDFADRLQYIIDTYNDGGSFVLISSDSNIYAQNKLGSFIVSEDNKDKLRSFDKSSYNKYLDKIKKSFPKSSLINVKKEFKTTPKKSDDTYTSKSLALNSSKLNNLSLSSTWLPVPIVRNQYGLCWAASCASVLNYRLCTNLTPTQIADDMHMDYNKGANIYQISDTLKHYGDSNARGLDRILSDNEIETYINFNAPIIMGTHSDIGPHATVIRGYMVGDGFIQISMMNPNLDTYQAAYAQNGSYYYVMDNNRFVWRETAVYF